MNDLERDLTELFETKAGGLDTTPLAPPAVLRRGRRRQVGTVVGGALMAVAAAAVVVGGASAFLTDRAIDPPMGERDVLPARTATIGGVTVTAPEGWSLLDQSTLAIVLPTETCFSEFEGTATPVGADGGGSSEEPVLAAPVEDCTPVDLPGGVPLFTLANVEPNPLQTVCEVTSELPLQGVGPTDAYLYVALDPNPAAPGASWPAELDTILPGTCGTAEQAWWTVDGVGYMAAVAIGEDASQADRDAVLTAFEELRFAGEPQPSASPVVGYVVAAGVEDGAPWRLEAGPNLLCEGGGVCSVYLALITTAPTGRERSWIVTPPTDGFSVLSGTETVGGTTIAFGTASSDVEAIEVVTTDWTVVTPTSVAWPTPLEAYASDQAPVDGAIWWTVVPDVASIDAVLEDGSTVSGDSEEVSPPDVSGEEPSIADLRLETRMVGDELVASGDGWEVGMGPEPGSGRIMPRILIGEDEHYLSLGQGSGQTTAMSDGALSITVLAPDEGPVSVTLDDTGETLYGRWMPGPDQFGKDSRWWVLPLPGVGSGVGRHGPDDLPTATSWPPGRPPAAGVVAAAGTFGFGDISWKFAYTSADCLVLARVAGGDPSIGQTDCLEVPGLGERLVAFAAGDESSLIAFVGPEGLMTLDGPGPDGETISGQCSGSGGFDEGIWAQHGICAIAIPNDVDVTLQPMGWDPDTKEDVPLDPITVRVSDGELFLTDGG